MLTSRVMTNLHPTKEALNICFVSQNFPILGRSADYGFLWPIARGLAKRGHKVTVLSWRNPEQHREIQQENIQAFFLGESSARNIKDFPRLALEKFKQLNEVTSFNLVHGLDDSAYLIGRNKKALKVKMAYDVEATKMSRVFAIFGFNDNSLWGKSKTAFKVASYYLISYHRHDRKILTSADVMFVTTPQQRLALERHYYYPDKRTFSVPYSIDLGDLSPKEQSTELKKSLSIPEHAKVMVVVTDMSDPLEVTPIFKAFERIVIKKPSSRLIIVGHGPYLKQLEFEMLNLALANKVLFVGALEQKSVSDYIAISDVFIDLSHRTSGFEPSLIEAMAQKKVVIGSETSAMAQIIENHVDGYLIRPADIGSLIKILDEVFSERVQISEIGNSARKKVMSFFNSKSMVAEILRAYSKALGRKIT